MPINFSDNCLMQMVPLLALNPLGIIGPVHCCENYYLEIHFQTVRRDGV